MSCYNKDTKTFCNKKCSDWFKLLCYFVGFMVTIFIIFLVMLKHFERKAEQGPGEPPIRKISISDNASPGLAFLPSATSGKLEHSLIWYQFTGKDAANNRRASIYAEVISNFLIDEQRHCRKDRKCDLQLYTNERFGPCGVSDYGYSAKKPCVFLKLNRLNKWIPEPYEDKKFIPKFVPSTLKSIINVTRQAVFVECHGASDYDAEHIGLIKYYPEQVFHENYFPMLPETHLTPLIAIQFENLPTGYILSVTCNTYAANIKKLKGHTMRLYIDNK